MTSCALRGNRTQQLSFSELSARRRITLSTVVPHTFPTRIELRTGQVWLVPFLV
jgi:hypothetical protein